MAIISQQQQDEANGQQQPPSGPTQISGTSAGSGTGQGAGTGTGQNTSAAPVSGVAQNQAPQASQGYTDVASYLDANQQGSQQLGQGVASNLTNQYNTTKGGIDTSAQATTQAANAGYTPYNENLINQVAADPTQAAANQDTLKQYQAQLNNSYTGPSNWADLGTQQGNVDIANQEAGLTKTPGGLNVLTSQLEQKLNPGQTSQGINQLDTMLLGGSPTAMQTVQSAADPYSTLNDYINQQNTNITGAINQGQTQAAQSSQNALNSMMGTYGNLNTQIGNETTAAQQAAQTMLDQQNGLLANINNLYGGQALQSDQSTLGTYNGSTPWYNTTEYNVGQLSPQDLATMGITQEQWNSLRGGMQQAATGNKYGANYYGAPGHFGAITPTTQDQLTNYISGQLSNPSAINAGNVANQSEYQKMAAINALLGDKAPKEGELINPQMSNLAGTAPVGNTAFDYAKALSDIQNYNTQAGQITQEEANAIESNADLQHAQSQHGGFWNSLKQDFSNPLRTMTALANPLSTQSNVLNLATGNQLNPGDMRQPFDPIAMPIAGGIVGGIVGGGPVGATAGTALGGLAGQGSAALGNALTSDAIQNTPDNTPFVQPLPQQPIVGAAHGGEIEEYLDNKKVK
jgi:hypothetical protein